MKTCHIAIALLVLITYSKPVLAAEVLHVFGGIPVKVERQQAESCDPSHYTILQTSLKFGTTVDDLTSVKCEENKLRLAFPIVRRSTQFLLEHQTDGLLKEVVVYPHNLMKPLVNWSHNHPLIVQNPDEKLTNFLKKQGAVVQFPNPLSEGKLTKIIAGDAEIIFREDTPPFPKIIIEPKKVDVNMKFLDGLEKDPLRQIELVKLFEELDKSTTHKKTSKRRDRE